MNAEVNSRMKKEGQEPAWMGQDARENGKTAKMDDGRWEYLYGQNGERDCD